MKREKEEAKKSIVAKFKEFKAQILEQLDNFEEVILREEPAMSSRRALRFD